MGSLSERFCQNPILSAQIPRAPCGLLLHMRQGRAKTMLVARRRRRAARREPWHEVWRFRGIEIRGNFRGQSFVQEKVRVAYELDGKHLWHDIGEDAPRQPPIENDEVQETGPAQWQKLSLRCCYSHASLSDPARCLSCNHPPSCNFDSLLMSLKSSRTCPVAGCTVSSMRSRDVRTRRCAPRGDSSPLDKC